MYVQCTSGLEAKCQTGTKFGAIYADALERHFPQFEYTNIEWWQGGGLRTSKLDDMSHRDTMKLWHRDISQPYYYLN